MKSLVALLVAVGISTVAANFQMRMPNVQPKVHDTYLCHSLELPTEPQYIVGFVPKINQSTAHHMLLFTCSEKPPVSDKAWNCGEMSKDGKVDDQFKVDAVCKGKQSIMYGWAMDAKALSLPKGVGFRIGTKQDPRYLVLQVHYKNAQKAPDKSGLELVTTTEKQPHLAGVYYTATGGIIPAKSTVYFETACTYEEEPVLHPFAYRVHAHKHGKVNSGYRIRNNEWTEIGRKSPQLPEMFYNVTTAGMTIKKGDIIATRCTMVNDEDREVDVGPTNDDEMCNFYIMYYTDQHLPSADTCSSGGYPSFSWQKSEMLSGGKIPSEASIVPGTETEIKEMITEMDDLENEIERDFEGEPDLYDDFIRRENSMFPGEDDLEDDDDEMDLDDLF